MMGVELTEESKELFSIAYQNVASGKRASLRRLESVEKTEKSKGNLTSVRMVKAYRQKVKAPFGTAPRCFGSYTCTVVCQNRSRGSQKSELHWLREQ